MYWNFHKIVVICTGGAMIFSPNTTNRTETGAASSYGITKVGARGVGFAGIGASRAGSAGIDAGGMGSAGMGASGASLTGINAGGTVAGSARRGTREEPYCIYLTWDDGPSEGSRIVNALSLKDSLSINVFLIGRNACLTEKNRAMVMEYETNPLVEVGNHSFTHANRKYETFFRHPAEVLADFNRSRDSLHLANGLTRLPGRNFFRVGGFSRDDRNNGKESADTLAANGYKVYGWDLEWRRKAGRGIATHTGEGMLEIVDEMLRGHRTFLPGCLVLLLHDQDCRDVHFRDEVEEFIRLARADGRYRFGHLSEWTAGGDFGVREK